MSDSRTAITCGNCGAVDVLSPCVEAWGAPHTHPRAHDDFTAVRCDLMLCGGCYRQVATWAARNGSSEQGGE